MVLRFFGTLLGIAVAAIAGNWLGSQVRAFVDNEPSPQFDLIVTSESGERVVNVGFLRENSLPAIMASFIGKPRWLYAFIGGVVYSGFFDEESKKLLASSVRRLR